MTKKQKLGPIPLVYPIPIALVGVMVEDHPNFTEVGDVGIMGIKPPYVFVSLGEKSHSKRGNRGDNAIQPELPRYLPDGQSGLLRRRQREDR